ncbi:polyprenyl synthetase family protein [Gordonia amarae]|uniref:polyprenyl synthetase family protein n=1 Tax=Gordonia amarae TaxID=36821 RepID=UPI001AF91F39|nr:polyprenyl synthetase family protein [Gordonia amarae]QHN31424.1 polyprenyl synthetase family protein [Gordonia amarae]
MTSAHPVDQFAIPSGLDDVPAAVCGVLDDFFGRVFPHAAAIDPVVGEAATMLREFTMNGGKRIRPTLVYAGWRCGVSERDRLRPGDGDNPAEALRAGAAIELIQACALVHDDIIDRSDTRRGRPTIHRELESTHADAGWSGSPAAFGVAGAILIGDLALSWADDLFHGVGVAEEMPAGPLRRGAARRAGAVWAAMRTEVLGGQILDVVNESRGNESVSAAYRVMEFKTAAYTVARPLELGATLAGGSVELINALRSIGHDLGIAFQLRDDLLGVFGDPEQTGKPSGDDLVAGKRTALIAVGLNRAGAAVGGELRGLIGRELSAEELARAREILVDVGAVADMEQRIDHLGERAQATITALNTDDSVRAELSALGHRLGHRQR